MYDHRVSAQWTGHMVMVVKGQSAIIHDLF